MKKVLVTGCAGFIGYHVCRRLLNDGNEVCGLDNLNEYYDVNLKKARLRLIATYPRFRFTQLDIADRQRVGQLFQDNSFEAVVHLAAQAGVRYSLTDPLAYVDSNLAGFANVLEGCRHSHVAHMVFASSSSVYGAGTLMPFSPHRSADHPVSLYAATKRANELMAHAYSHLFQIPSTGLRFFTVYGPWGRPDMALFRFTRAILAEEPIQLFNFGHMQRDFTYIDDAVESVVRILGCVPQADPGWDSLTPDLGTSSAPWRILNVGNHNPIDLLTLLGVLEAKLAKRAVVELAPLQAGDIPATQADVEDLTRLTGFKPQTSISTGVGRFVDWFREYYKV